MRLIVYCTCVAERAKKLFVGNRVWATSPNEVRISAVPVTIGERGRGVCSKCRREFLVGNGKLPEVVVYLPNPTRDRKVAAQLAADARGGIEG